MRSRSLSGDTMTDEVSLERKVSYGIGGAGNVRRPTEVARDAVMRFEAKAKKAAGMESGEQMNNGGRRRSSIMRLLGRRESPPQS